MSHTAKVALKQLTDSTGTAPSKVFIVLSRDRNPFQITYGAITGIGIYLLFGDLFVIGLLLILGSLIPLYVLIKKIDTYVLAITNGTFALHKSNGRKPFRVLDEIKSGAESELDFTKHKWVKIGEDSYQIIGQESKDKS